MIENRFGKPGIFISGFIIRLALIMECNTPFSDFIIQCPDGLIVNAHLTPATNYQWLIEDKFGKEYSGPLTTNAEGNFTIALADLPDGLLNPFAGTFKLQVLELYSAAPVELFMQAAYDAIFFDVKGGTRVKENLGIA